MCHRRGALKQSVFVLFYGKANVLCVTEGVQAEHGAIAPYRGKNICIENTSFLAAIMRPKNLHTVHEWCGCEKLFFFKKGAEIPIRDT